MTDVNSSISNSGDHSSGLALAVSTLFVVTLLVLAMVQSASLVTLSYDLEPGALNERIVVAAEQWHGWMSDLGVAGITEYIGETVLEAHDAPVEG